MSCTERCRCGGDVRRNCSFIVYAITVDAIEVGLGLVASCELLFNPRVAPRSLQPNSAEAEDPSLTRRELLPMAGINGREGRGERHADRSFLLGSSAISAALSLIFAAKLRIMPP